MYSIMETHNKLFEYFIALPLENPNDLQRISASGSSQKSGQIVPHSLLVVYNSTTPSFSIVVPASLTFLYTRSVEREMGMK